MSRTPGTDSPRSLSTEIEAAPKHCRALATERLESSLEIPETPAVVLEKIRREKDDPSNDNNTPSHVCECWSTATEQNLDEEYHGGSTQTIAGASVVVGDTSLEVDRTGSVVRNGPHSEHDIGSVKTNSLQRADRTDPVVNTDDSDGAFFPIAEPSGQILAPITVSALSSPNIGEGGPVMINISNFTTAHILDKGSSPFGVESRCELGPMWLSSVLVGKTQMGGVQIQSYENEVIRAGRLGTLRERKRKRSRMYL
jgi:hypothetical protein